MHLSIGVWLLVCMAASSAYCAEHWKQAPCPPNHTVDILLAVRHENEQSIHHTIREVSLGSRPQLSWNNVAHLARPDAESLQNVNDWLVSFGVNASMVTSHPLTPEYLLLSLPVEEANELFQVELLCFAHTARPSIWISRSLSAPLIPRHLQQHLDLVVGIHGFPRIPEARAHRSQKMATLITPSVIASFLNTSSAHVSPYSNSSQAVAEFLGEWYSEADLAQYLTYYGLPNNTATVLGYNDPSSPGIESSLDIQVIMGTGVNVTTWFVSQRGGFVIDPFLEYILKMRQTPGAPWVHSISYSDVERDLDVKYMKRTSLEFAKFGIAGHTVLFSSGDDGVGCTAECDSFQPNWPASDPYVTSVGGILLESLSQYTAVGDPISSGGFSNVFKTPFYQRSAVAKYLQNTNLPDSKYYNNSGRGYPDIASFSEDVEIFVNLMPEEIGGTSCACPILGGFFALVNAARFERQLPPLGFINPMLYQMSVSQTSAFLDIVSGTNNAGCCALGFECSAGWDPVTGLGVPNYAVFGSQG